MSHCYQLGDLVVYHHKWSKAGVCVVIDMGKTGTGEDEKDIMVLYCFRNSVYYLAYDWEVRLFDISTPRQALTRSTD